MPHHPRLWNYSANKYVEEVGGQAAASFRCECADDGSQDEHAKSVPTHHEKVYMGKKQNKQKLKTSPSRSMVNTHDACSHLLPIITSKFESFISLMQYANSK